MFLSSLAIYDNKRVILSEYSVHAVLLNFDSLCACLRVYACVVRYVVCVVRCVFVYVYVCLRMFVRM